jgi:hypothetical protein
MTYRPADVHHLAVLTTPPVWPRVTLPIREEVCAGPKWRHHRPIERLLVSHVVIPSPASTYASSDGCEKALVVLQMLPVSKPITFALCCSGCGQERFLNDPAGRRDI